MRSLQEVVQSTKTTPNETEITNLNPLSHLVRTCEKKEKKKK